MKEPQIIDYRNVDAEFMETLEALCRLVVKKEISYWAVLRKFRRVLLDRALAEIGSPTEISRRLGISRPMIHRYKMGSAID